MSSSGEMKMSLRLITCCLSSALALYRAPQYPGIAGVPTYVLMLQMLEQFQLTVCSLGQDGCAERLHDLLHRHSLPCELILRRATLPSVLMPYPMCLSLLLTTQARRLPCPPAASPCTWTSISMCPAPHPSTSTRYLLHAYLLVISNVVPKICARTNSAIVSVLLIELAECV